MFRESIERDHPPRESIQPELEETIDDIADQLELPRSTLLRYEHLVDLGVLTNK